MEAVPGAIGFSKSTVPREFKKASAAKLRAFQERDDEERGTRQRIEAVAGRYGAMPGQSLSAPRTTTSENSGGKSGSHCGGSASR